MPVNATTSENTNSGHESVPYPLKMISSFSRMTRPRPGHDSENLAGNPKSSMIELFTQDKFEFQRKEKED